MFADLSFFVALGVTLLGGGLGIAAVYQRHPKVHIIDNDPPVETNFLEHLLNSDLDVGFVLMSDDNELIWQNNAASSFFEKTTSCANDLIDLGLGRSTTKIGTAKFDVHRSQTDCGVATVLTRDMTERPGSKTSNNLLSLTKLFAEVPLGLAVFDKDHSLILFNPALCGLTNQNPSHLCSKPTILSFLDSLRQGGIFPESIGFSEWRQKTMDLKETALQNGFTEEWTVPSGQTIRVSGRPFANGATVLMFEDISSEVERSRGLTAQISVFQNALDQQKDPIAFFNSDGTMVFANGAYRSEFGQFEDSQLCLPGVLETSLEWEKVLGPNSCWGDIREFVVNPTERTEWIMPLFDQNHPAHVKCVPLPDLQTMVQFVDCVAMESLSEENQVA